jgi:hypothetical protein
MALTLPVLRNIVISEKREYTLKYLFCDLGLVPNNSDISAFAVPLFSVDCLFVGFVGQYSERPVTRFFGAGENLRRFSGVTKLGKTQEFSAELPYSVVELIPFNQWPLLQTSVSGSALTVTLPFGATFSRYVDPVSGKMDKASDLEPRNDPAKYYYTINHKNTYIAGGVIDITIDLGVDVVKENTEVTVCSVQVA